MTQGKVDAYNAIKSIANSMRQTLPHTAGELGFAVLTQQPDQSGTGWLSLQERLDEWVAAHHNVVVIDIKIVESMVVFEGALALHQTALITYLKPKVK